MQDSLNQHQIDPEEPSKPSILCIVDSFDWIFYRHVKTLDRYLGDEFEFSAVLRGQPYDENAYDLIYPLEYDMVTPDKVNRPAKYVTGIRSLISWSEADFLTLVNLLVTHFQMVHVLSRELYNFFAPYIPDLQYIPNGVDTELFSPIAPPDDQPGKLRLGWAGNRLNPMKGFQQFIEPLSSVEGVELKYCGFADRNLTLDEMPGFYNTIDAYISASSFEGTNNPVLEAAAMERAIITTQTGTVPEYLMNKVSAMIVEREYSQFVNAVKIIRDDPEFRKRIGKQARQAILKGGWDWNIRAQVFRPFFRKALENSKAPLPNRIVIDHPDWQHYANVVHKQFTVVRELRINQTLQNFSLQDQLIKAQSDLAEKNQLYDDLKLVLEQKNRDYIDLNQELAISNQKAAISNQMVTNLEQELTITNHILDETQQELSEIKNSETYRLSEFVKKFKISQALIWLYNRFKK